MEIVIIYYCIGNLRSIQKFFEKQRELVRISDDHTLIGSADKLVLLGVGTFVTGMRGLRERGLVEVVEDRVLVNVPILGNCLGMEFYPEKSQIVGRQLIKNFIELAI